MLVDASQLKDLLNKDRLFDARWYSRRYKLTGSQEELLEEYVTSGVLQNRSPNPLFDADFYLDRYRNFIAADASPFVNYATEGVTEQRNPHPLIDAKYVREQLDAAQVPDGVMHALLHKSVSLLIDPCPGFSTSFYLTRYPEIRQRRIHPFIHYIESGRRENRLPHPLFWPEWFVAMAPAAVDPNNALLDYLTKPSLFHASPNPYFDVPTYLARYRDLANVEVNLLAHYVRFGLKEGRVLNPAIEIDWFNKTYAKAMSVTRLDPLSFVLKGDEGFVRANAAGKPLFINPALSAQLVAKHRRLAFPKPRSPHRRRRIVYISHNLRMQGAQTSLFELAVGFKHKRNYDVHVFAPDLGPMRERYAAEGIPITTYRLPVAGLPDKNAYESLLQGYRHQLEALAPDIVHGNTVQSYHGLALAARLGIPTVWNIRESEDPLSHGSSYHEPAVTLLQEAFAKVKCFAFVSRSTRTLWQEVFPDIESTVIQNGVDYSRLAIGYRGGQRDAARAALGITDNEFVILTVGTWTERKGQRDIVQALPKIDRRRWPHVKLLLIGANMSDYGQCVQADIGAATAALRERIQVVAETNGLADRVRVIQAYLAADLFVFTSRIESYPRVVNEAMYFGLPIIAAPCFGVTEQLVDNESARFYRAGDTDQLASFVTQMWAHPEMRQAFGRASREAALKKVMQYDGMLDRYDAMYQTLAP